MATIDELNFKLVVDDKDFDTRIKEDLQTAKEFNAQVSKLLSVYQKYDAKKMFEYFRAAGIAGSADAIFMCGVCGYYGIGTKLNRGDAIKALKIWQEMTHAEVREGGWVHRRLSE